MKKFIAYFDYLGYKQFLESNNEEFLRIRAGHILRDIEMALSDGRIEETFTGLAISDLKDTKINCLNISDTVIFWTLEDSIEQCKELIKVAYRFNWQQNLYNFPVRGCLLYDEFNFITGSKKNNHGAIYSPNLMYGRGLLNAHTKSENLNWAGTVIDQSLVHRVKDEMNFSEFIKAFAVKYNVPYKNFYKNEFALLLGKPIALNDAIALNSRMRQVKRVFEADNKAVSPSVEVKINNTINFLKSILEKDDE